MEKGILHIDIQKCAYCGGCTAVCPNSVISLHDETKLEINKELCKCCNLCVVFCPMGALRISGRDYLKVMEKL